MARRLVAGVDCSTQQTKVVVVDADDGLVVDIGRAPHEVTGTGGARETDPHVWTTALQSALAATKRAAQIAAISVAGQQHGLVVCDERGRPLRPAVLWNDTRSAADAAALVDDLGGAHPWAHEIGVVPVPSFTVTTWAWLRRSEPHVAAAARSIRLPHDHITACLVGRPATDRGDASGTGWWSTRSEQYAPAVLNLERVRLDPALLPAVLAPAEPAGTVNRAASELFQLPAGILVGPGTGDNMGAALGVGLAPGAVALSLGTSGTVYAVSERRPADPSGIVAGFADATGRYLPLAATLNATLAVDRMAAWLRVDREAVDPGGDVVVLPYLDGERTPNLPAAAGTITGLRHTTTPGQILRATYEGVVVSLLDALAHIAEQAGGLRDDMPLTLLGGGARGRVWQEVVARLSGRPLLVPDVEEPVALGAAVQAAAVLDETTPEAVAQRWNAGSGHVLPAVPRNEETLQRHAAVRAATAMLNR